MIFRTDTFELLSTRAVNALSMNVVADVLVNPKMLTTCSWRRLLPTMALHLNFSTPECLAIGDWKDVKAVGDEAPVTSSYAEGKEGKSRTCKTICAVVFAKLASRDISTFEEVSAQQWEELAIEARAEVGSKPLDVNVAWRNPDVEESEGGVKLKNSQTRYPMQSAGVPLAPSSRDGKGYCVDLQCSSCRGGDECSSLDLQCRFGLYRCAAVFRGGRACHGIYPGSERESTRRHAGLGEGNPQGSPARKKMKVDVPAEQPVRKPGKTELSSKSTQPAHRKGASRGPANPEKVSTPEHVEDDSIMRKMLPKLSEERYEKRGHSLDPEPPRLVAKVCEEEGRGELWLGPLPTAQTIDMINETKPSIQIYCLAKSPMDVQVEPDGKWGMVIPWTEAFRCEMSNPHVRSRDVRALRTCVINSLRQGDNAYVHCISGISEAPMAAALLSAMLMKTSFEAAQGIIDQTRNVSFGKGERHMLGPWIDTVLGEDICRTAIPTGFSCRAVKHGEVVVHAMTVGGGGTEPICGSKLWQARQDFELDGITVGSIEKAANQFGGRFCCNCERRLKASLKIQVERFFS